MLVEPQRLGTVVEKANVRSSDSLRLHNTDQGFEGRVMVEGFGGSFSEGNDRSMQARIAMELRQQVAITGTLSVPPKDAAALINSTSNARFHRDVTFQTNYLVAAIMDSGKARKAAKLGVAIITGTEMMQFVASATFPENSVGTRVPHVNNFPKSNLSEARRRFACFPEHEDGDGLVTQTFVLVCSEGTWK
jgi:hypothetical protein